MEKNFNTEAKNGFEGDPAFYFIADAFLETAKKIENQEQGKKDKAAFDESDAFLKAYNH